MDPRAYRVAQAFVEAHVRRARYSPEFLQWTDGRQFRNSETGNEVKFLSLPPPEQTKIYRQWAKDKGGRPEGGPARGGPEAAMEADRRNLDIARNGKIVASEVLSTGGQSSEGDEKKGVNQSFIVKLDHDGQEQVFIRKPAEGEEKFLRVGIPGGTYHAREQAAYELDSLMGGRGIVPVTATRGAEDGSYQVWVEGARAMHGDDLDDLTKKVKPEDLHKSPDFQRANVFDLITGHEDRHRGNMMYHFDGEETPENLRLVAIDNGLTMASPGDQPSWKAYAHPFDALYLEDENASDEEQRKVADDARGRGNKAVAETLSDVSPELHEQIKGIDLGDAAKAIAGSGIDDEGAVRATLVRIAALQEDPKIFAQMLKRRQGQLDEAWQDFQHESGADDRLLKMAGAGGRAADIDKALEAAKPEKGWGDPEKIQNFFTEMQDAVADMDGWGDTKPAGGDATPRDDAATRRTGPSKPGGSKRDDDTKYDSWGFAVASVRDRWLRSALRRTSSSSGRPSRGRP